MPLALRTLVIAVGKIPLDSLGLLREFAGENSVLCRLNLVSTGVSLFCLLTLTIVLNR